MQQLFPVYRDERAIFDRWEELVIRHEVKGTNAHDARIVAAMLHHRLTHLLTFNESHFKRFTDITVLTPIEVAARPTA
jgi:predicted nucleic acid-binding protein